MAKQGTSITMEEAVQFFSRKTRFTKLSANAMFSEVDENKDGKMTKAEWDSFWVQVKGHGYTDEDIITEVEEMLNGGSWVDWNDNREPAQQPNFQRDRKTI